MTETSALQPSSEAEDIPEDILKMKEELEKKTGKKHTYREPRQDIKTLLLIGAVQDEPQTLWDAIKLGLGMGALFVVSFFVYYVLFFQYPSKVRTGKMDLSSRMPFLKSPPAMSAHTEPKQMHHGEF
jgi:hypothetical protein